MKKILLLILGVFMLEGYVNQKTVFIADPEVVSIPIVENHESFIDMKDQTLVAYGPSPEIPNNTDYTKVRKTIYEKLVQAQALLPHDLKFCLYEGYRSLTLQNILFEERFKRVKAQHPQWTQQQIFQETTRLVSPIVNLDGSKNIPPHSTGAAIDVYLVNQQGQPVNMGIHPKDWMADINGTLSKTSSQKISMEARHYRKIMSHALSTVGFVNYPTEYWHWSYGDRYWAYSKQEKHAIYGEVPKK